MKKTISQITRSLLIDAGVFGYSTIEGKTFVSYLDGKGYIRPSYATKKQSDQPFDEYDRAVQTAFEKWKADNRLSPRAAFTDAVRRYQEAYPGWRSPQGRPFPDHHIDAADDEARRIMQEVGIV